MIKIGDFAKICNVSTQTLRYYDIEGVLKPNVIDSTTGYRFYSLDAVDKFKLISFYKKLGFSLDEIKKLQTATKDQTRDMLQKRKEELLCSINQFDNLIKIIDDALQNDSEKTLFSELMNLPFSDDPQVIGKWELCGKLLDENNLTCLEEVSSDIADKEIIFMPNGAIAWKYFWTKGTLYRICPKYKFVIPNAYKTIQKGDLQYMIIQYMSNDCIDYGKDCIVLLYRQVDQIAYTEYQIRPHIDETDLPFFEDEAVHGEWLAFDYIPKLSNFDPDKKYSEQESINTINLCFLSRGICTKTVSTTNKSTKFVLRYTKGFVLNDSEKTAEEYQIKKFNGRDFLFVQHKSGDYIYGGMTPHWYVFERKDKKL